MVSRGFLDVSVSRGPVRDGKARDQDETETLNSQDQVETVTFILKKKSETENRQRRLFLKIEGISLNLVLRVQRLGFVLVSDFDF